MNRSPEDSDSPSELPGNPIGPLGVEIELLAPAGRTRQDLADALAAHYGATVRRFFHPQGEPSKARNTPFFENLTLGFAVEDAAGNLLAQCVDDLTLQDDLDRHSAPKPGWYRIVSDDPRLLRLTMRHADPAEPLEKVLLPIARLFGTDLQKGTVGMIRVADEAGTPIAIGATLPGERERPCELVTAPLRSDHLRHLGTMLGLARDLGFTVPAEGATHLHFDGAPLSSASTLANLVRFLGFHTAALKTRMGTNPRCRRLGMWPAELFDLVATAEFAALEWPAAREHLQKIELTKYCDFNILNLVRPIPNKHTFEVRILPVWLDAEKIMEAATLFSAILHWAKGTPGQLRPVPDGVDEILR